MNKKRIQEDYKNIDYVDASGKVRTDVVYMGKHYVLEKPEMYNMFRISFIALTVLIIAAFILPLCFQCNITKQLYFTLPFVVQGFAVLVLIFGSYKTITKKPPFREEAKTMIFTYSRVGCVIGIILTLASTIGMIVYTAKSGIQGFDMVGVVCSPLCVLLYLAEFVNVNMTKVNAIAAGPSQKE